MSEYETRAEIAEKLIPKRCVIRDELHRIAVALSSGDSRGDSF
jgi:hypothetical protein